jgi:hypothetical protein
MSRIKIWNRVPDRSRLEVAVDSPATITAKAFLTVSDGHEEDWPDASLRPGPKSLLLRTPKLYSVIVDLKFAAVATATVNAKIVKPDGAVYGDAHSVQVAGTAGEVKTVAIGVITLQS